MTSTERRVQAARLIVPVLAAGAAITTLAVAHRMRNGPGTMGLGLSAFAGMWTLMMAAMMLPSISPSIRRCLVRCRQILIIRPGASALRQGLTNGGWCLACNWASMLVLLAFGLMNVAAMAVIAGLVYAEIHRPRGSRVSRLTAVIATACATLVLVDPPLAPGLHHALTITNVHAGPCR